MVRTAGLCATHARQLREMGLERIGCYSNHSFATLLAQLVGKRPQ
jgi:hypothetical protein